MLMCILFVLHIDHQGKDEVKNKKEEINKTKNEKEDKGIL